MKRKKAAAGSAETSLRDEAVALVQRLLENPTLRETVDTLLSEAASAPEAVTTKKRRCGKCRAKLVLLVPIAGIGALAASAPLRSKVLDALFGAEEEFEYSPPTDGPAV